MRIILALILGAGLGTSPASAKSLVEVVGQPAKVLPTGKFDIPLHAEARLHSPKAPETGWPLYATGAGIYYKKILGAKVKVNATISYIDNPGGINVTNPLDSVGKSAHKAMMLIALRDLSSEEIRTAFEDALDANDISLQAPGIRELLAQITFDLPAGRTATLANVIDGAHDTVHVECGDLVFHSEATDLGLSVWKIWFGIPFDDGVAALKPLLMRGL